MVKALENLGLDTNEKVMFHYSKWYELIFSNNQLRNQSLYKYYLL